MAKPSNGGKRILVVNDDPAILALFEELLGEEGYEVTIDRFARQTGDLLQSIRDASPDLVIMDFIIGREESGWQLLQAMRMDRTTRDIPIIMCTGAVKQVTELREQLDTMGVQVVTKPFDIDHLLEVIAAVWAGSPTPRSALRDESAGRDANQAKGDSAVME
ncbi:MAG TPA: response regulator [Thermomicrobiales bacterium]|nr:response regulator [Thermomicrobiales bacterium]